MIDLFRVSMMAPLAALLVLNVAAAAEPTPQPAWAHDMGAPVVGTPVAHGDRILAAAGHALVALRQDGRPEWEVELPGEALSTPVTADRRIYIHTTAGLSAFDDRRDQLWHYPDNDRGALVDGRTWGWGDAILSDPWAFYRSSPLVTETAIVFGSSSGVHAVNPDSGERVWYRPTAPVTADIVGQDDAVIVADWSNRLRRFNVADGALEWTFSARLPWSSSRTWVGWMGLNLTPVIADGQLFLGSRGTFFYALDLEKGTELWSSKHGTSWIGSAAIAHEGQVYFGLSDGKALIGIDRASGNQSLFVPASGAIFATPLVVDGQLIAGTLTGELMIVNLEQGRLVRSVALQDNPKPYASYFTPDPESELSPQEFTASRLELLKKEQRVVLGLAAIGSQLLVGTGSGEVVAFDLADLLSVSSGAVE